MFPNGYTSILDLQTSKIKSINIEKLPKVSKFNNNLILAKKIIKKIIKSVKRKFISDVPCGVSLSGGIDSSIIAGLVKKELKYKKVKFLV